MATFAELKAENAGQWGMTTAGRDLTELPWIANIAEEFFTEYGFTALEFMTRGSSAIILKDRQNPALIFRIAPTYDKRALVPQMLQPLHVENLKDDDSCRVKIEVLPNIDAEFLPDQEFERLLAAYRSEVKASGYWLDSDNLKWDVGAFTYEDPVRPGQKKTVIMGADASLIPTDAVNGPPTCTEDYPTLEMQWKEQCKMVDADPRLKKLLGGLPAKLPLTRVINSPLKGSYAAL